MPINACEKQLFTDLNLPNADDIADQLKFFSEDDLRASNAIYLELAGNFSNSLSLDKYIPTRDQHQVRIKIFNPQSEREPTLFFFQGNGYICDLFEINAIAASRIAAASGCKIIVIDHRLAPEFPLSLAIQDCYDAIIYLLNNSKQFDFEINRNAICLGGFSSGAHCALAVNHLTRQAQSFVSQQLLLLNGMYDLTEANLNFVSYEQEDKLCLRVAAQTIYGFYGLEEEDYQSPLYSPIYETDFASTPSTHLIISEYGGMRSDSEAYYEYLRRQDVDVSRTLLPGQTHNTFLSREAMYEGTDPAEVIAEFLL